MKKDPAGEDEQNQKVAEPHLGRKKVDELKMEIDFQIRKIPPPIVGEPTRLFWS